jgi:hypothetical protein
MWQVIAYTTNPLSEDNVMAMTADFDEAYDYVRALESDPTLAIVPFQVAADAWDVSRATIDGMVRNDRLEGVRIAKTRYVRASSLNGLISAWLGQVAQVTKSIEKHARKREVVFYEPLMTPLGLKTTVPADRKRIGAILGAIAKESFDEHGFLLTAIVHRNAAGKTHPGPGFVKIARELGIKFSDEEKFVATEIAKVWNHYSG